MSKLLNNMATTRASAFWQVRLLANNSRSWKLSSHHTGKHTHSHTGDSDNSRQPTLTTAEPMGCRAPTHTMSCAGPVLSLLL